MSSALQSDAPGLRLGTRGSPLALIQAEQVKAALIAAHGWPERAVELIIVKTSGDRIRDRPLVDIGGKGLFVKELEEALSAGTIDAAVHSMKDVPTLFEDRFELAAFLPRVDPRDALICPRHRHIADLPKGAVVGTSSPRRRAQLLHLRPDLTIRDFRGNVGTRLAKLEAGEADATILAAAGLARLGKSDAAAALIPVEEMLPAAAQGVIGIEIRRGDDAVAALFRPLNHNMTAIAVGAERAVLAELNGSCRTPIAAYAEVDGARLHLRAMLAHPDGTCASDAIEGSAAEGVALGYEIGRRLKANAPAGSLK